MLPDSISTPRGLGVKVIGVEGQAVSQEHEGHGTQDFVMVNGKAFGVPGPAEFLKQAQLLEKHATDSEGLKQAVSTTARIIEKVVEAFGGSSDALKQFGHLQTHLIGETFYTQVPLRYGDYIAKICIALLSANLTALTGKHVDLHGQFSGLRDSIVEFFRIQGGVGSACSTKHQSEDDAD